MTRVGSFALAKGSDGILSMMGKAGLSDSVRS